MIELDFARYSSAFQRFLPNLALPPLGETAKSRESPWFLVKTSLCLLLSVDSSFCLPRKQNTSSTVQCRPTRRRCLRSTAASCGPKVCTQLSTYGQRHQ